MRCCSINGNISSESNPFSFSILSIYRGVPFSKLRIIVLEMFKKTYEDNDLEYESAVQVCFQEQIPTSFKNVCSFADEDRIEDVLKVCFLNDQGLYVLLVYEDRSIKSIIGNEEDFMDLQEKFPKA